MEWHSVVKKDDNSLIIPDRWLHLHYFEALNILFRTENSLRVFVYVVLKNLSQDKWDETMVQVSEDKQLSITSIASSKISKQNDMGYLGYPIKSPLMYMNSGELTRLITSASLWEHFKKYFKASQTIIKTKFDEISVVRNSLAHFRPIKIDDIELIKQNVKHTFLAIEDCLNEINTITNVVPSNTAQAWYKTLSKLSLDPCSVQLYQSKSEEWIRIELVYDCPMIEVKKLWEGYLSFKVLNLLSPSVVKLKDFYSLKKFCTYVTEFIPYISMENDKLPSFRKQTSLIFSKAIISEHYEEIENNLENLLKKIKEESDLIKEDNLARGELVEAARATARYTKDKKDEKSGWWSVEAEGLKCPYKEDDPAEYWGETGFYESDFIAGSTKYPWIPSDISKEEFPF